MSVRSKQVLYKQLDDSYDSSTREDQEYVTGTGISPMQAGGDVRVGIRICHD